MRLLLIHQYFLPKGQGGGSRFNQFTRMWKRSGIETTVVAGTVHYGTGEADPRFKGRIVTDERTDEGVRVRWSHVSASYNRSFVGRLWAYFSFTISATWAALTAGRQDIVLATSPPLFAGIPGLIAARLRRIPFVFEIRDLWPESAVDTGVLTNPFLIRLSFWVESLMYRSAARVNVLTPAFRDRLIEDKGVPADKIWFVPNAADLDLFEPRKRENAVREEFGLQGKFVVSYMGAHGVANHLEQLLETAELLRDDSEIQFLLVGDGMEKPRLVEEARRRGLGNVRFVGMQAKERIPDYCNASDVCTAVLKKVDAFKTVYPNKVFDYMATARPIIVAIDGAARELVVDAGAGLYVPPEDPAAFARAIRYLKENPVEAEEMGRQGRAFVERNFDRRVLARRYERHLRELLARA